MIPDSNGFWSSTSDGTYEFITPGLALAALYEICPNFTPSLGLNCTIIGRGA